MFEIVNIIQMLIELNKKTMESKSLSPKLREDFSLILEKLNDPIFRRILTISDIQFIRFLTARKDLDYSRESMARRTSNLIDRLSRAQRVIGGGVSIRREMISPYETRRYESRIQELEDQLNEAKNSENNLDLEEITLESLKGKKILFGIMSFNSEYNDVWEGAIKRSAKNAGFFPLRVDMITKSSDISDDIIEAIKKSDVIIVDVTKNNPNVMFEFGYALALKKSPIIISQSTDYLSFDIQNMRTIIYQNTWQGIEKLNTDLSKFIKSSSKTKEKK